MDPKVAVRKQLDAAEATVKGLAELRQAIAALDEKVDALGRMIHALKKVKDGRTD